jgi:hypothetical protein
MNKNEIRVEVQRFWERTAYGQCMADCFPPWYLQQVFKISDEEAMRQSSEKQGDSFGPRGHDFGLDSFHLDMGEIHSPKLFLIQAKFSDSLGYISKGFKELEKCIPRLQMTFDEGVTGEPIENKVLLNLRKTLNLLDLELRKKLELDFAVIHLSDEDHEIIANRSRSSREDLKTIISELLPERKCIIRDIGPREMGPRQEIAVSSPWTSLSMTDLPVRVAIERGTMYFGVGHLAELVELYRERRHALFSKNVRYYLTSKDNVEKGAAGKMKETLREICNPRNQGSAVNSVQPETFALYHNGVTMYAHKVEPDDKIVKIQDPYVLNGCQTIMNAYLYRVDKRNKIDENRWKNVLVPLRILSTRDEELVRSVTISNNRQNAIHYAALRANDPVQLHLEERFRRVKVFYERQEGAYESLASSSAERLDEEYMNSTESPIRIVDLGRSIAAVSGQTGWARHPKDLFESDPIYGKVFSGKHLESLIFLTFLQNLHDVTSVVLKKDLGLERDGPGPKLSSLTYFVMCLLVRYLTKKNDREVVREFGGKTWGRKNQWREKTKLLLGNHHSKVKEVLQKNFLPLQDSETESLNGAFARSEAGLRLRGDIDCFEAFRNLDKEDK